MTSIASTQLADLLRHVALRIGEAREHLGELDGAIGDADHGSSMSEGFAAAARDAGEAAAKGVGAADLLAIAARSFLNAVGATTGPLYASAFAGAGRRLAGRAVLDDGDLVEILAGFAEGIAARGKAAPGDKTMMDAYGPAVRAAAATRTGGGSVREALHAAARAAAEGRDATRAMTAFKGRAARLGERSLGHVDPGAASAAIVVEALAEGYEAILAGRAGDAR